MKKSNYLLPYTCKKVAMWMFFPFAALCLAYLLDAPVPEVMVPWIAFGDGFFYDGKADLIKQLAMIGLLVSLCLLALSREKDEDEMTGQIRMTSFVWSLWATAVLLALGILFVMGLDFVVFACVAIFFYFIVYILRFNICMRKVRREAK